MGPIVTLTTPKTRSLEPFVFQDAEYGDAVSSVPSGVPSSLNCTPTTPTLSLALAVTVVVLETVAPPAGAVIETCGGTISGATSVVNVTSPDVARLLAASRDRTR